MFLSFKVVFALLVSVTAVVGSPIVCWTPVHFTGAHTKYTNSFCWVRNTYYLPWHKRIPRDWDDDSKQYVLYYQWIPFILLGQVCIRDVYIK